MPRDDRRRIALVGAGARAEMWVAAVVEHARLVAFADVDKSRMEAHNRRLEAAGHEPAPTYPVADLAAMLARERVDELIVTSVDATHAGHIVTALDAGCDVITEKPMTVDAASCSRILDAQQRSGKQVRVAFNYRFNPVHEMVRTRSVYEVVENDHISPAAAGELKGEAVHGTAGAPEQGGAHAHHPAVLGATDHGGVAAAQPHSRDGHGGADQRMTAVLLGGRTDPLARSATARDGALALLTVLAANQSLQSAEPVRVSDLLDLS